MTISSKIMVKIDSSKIYSIPKGIKATFRFQYIDLYIVL